MASIGTNEYELEDEFEDMYEAEEEYEDESEAESEAFFGSLLSLGKKALQNPVLKKAALSGARAALGNFGDFGQALGGLLPQEEFELEDEFEDEFEFEDEGEDEINPYKRIYSEAMMEHFGHAAMEAESEDEAEAFAKAMVPLARHVAPRSAPAIKAAAPHLVRSVANVAKAMLKNPHTRPLVRVLPSIVRSTAHHIARQSHGGHVPISPKKAVRILAHHTARTLGSPHRAVAAYRRSKALDKHAHTHGMPIRYVNGRVRYRIPSTIGRHAGGVPGTHLLRPTYGITQRPVYGGVPRSTGIAYGGIPKRAAVAGVRTPYGVVKPRIPRYLSNQGCNCCHCCMCRRGS